jgi:hypothetical protein
MKAAKISNQKQPQRESTTVHLTNNGEKSCIEKRRKKKQTDLEC